MVHFYCKAMLNIFGCFVTQNLSGDCAKASRNSFSAGRENPAHCVEWWGAVGQWGSSFACVVGWGREGGKCARIQSNEGANGKFLGGRRWPGHGPTKGPIAARPARGLDPRLVRENVARTVTRTRGRERLLQVAWVGLRVCRRCGQ